MKILELFEKTTGEYCRFYPNDIPKYDWTFFYDSDFHEVGFFSEKSWAMDLADMIYEDLAEDGSFEASVFWGKMVDSFYRYMKETEIVLPSGILQLENHRRRNYIRARGKPLTPELAADALVKTDCWLREELKISVRTASFGIFNGLATQHHFLFHPDGTVGWDTCSGIKYPEVSDVLEELVKLGFLCPYLDLCVIFTDDEEIPDELYDRTNNLPDDGDWRELYLDAVRQGVENPYDKVLFGARLQPGRLELLEKEDAVRVYREYDERYGCEDLAKYNSFYYGFTKENPLTEEFLQLCKKVCEVEK